MKKYEEVKLWVLIGSVALTAAIGLSVYKTAGSDASVCGRSDGGGRSFPDSDRIRDNAEFGFHQPAKEMRPEAEDRGHYVAGKRSGVRPGFPGFVKNFKMADASAYSLRSELVLNGPR